MKKIIIGFLASIGALFILFSISIFFLVKSYQERPAVVKPNSVLYLDLSGKIVEHKQTAPFPFILAEEGKSLYHIIQAIDAAAKDPKIIGIIAKIENVSMGMAQAQELREALLRFRAQGHDKHKYTFVYSDTFGESGPGTLSYYLATAFDEIWLQPLGQVGLTGLAVEVPFFKNLAADIGIEAEIGKREEYKSFADRITENNMTDANREELKTVLTSMMSQIVGAIASGREITEAEVMEAVNKGPLLDSEALKLGLIDRKGYFDEMKEHLDSKASSKPNVVSVYQYLSSQEEICPQIGQPKIALIYGIGMIMRGKESGDYLMPGNQMLSGSIIKAFQAATEDKDVSAIVFRVNSGGGSAIASESILHAMRNAQKAGKKIIVSMSDYAASGAYWISAFADKIIADPGTITGSIGVLSGKIVIEKLWKKLGVNWGDVSVGDNAMIWSMNQKYSKYGWERIQKSLDQIYSAFLQRVSEGRDLPLDHVEKIAKGRIWTGDEALKFGLVDKLGGLRDAIEIAKETVGLKNQVVPLQLYPQPRSLSDQIKALLSGGEGQEDVSALHSVFSGLMNGLATVMSFFDETRENIAPSIKAILPFKKVKG